MMKFLLFSWVFGTLVGAEAPPVKISSPASVVVIGGGVGALTSALYLARAGLHPVVIEGKEPGGLLTQSHSVQNWPGELEIEGQALMKKMRDHAEASGAQFLQEEVIGVDFSQKPFVVTTRSLRSSDAKRNLSAESCIIAMGTTPNFLEIPGERLYWGQGVTNCAVCDGALYRNRIVGVVGGGDAAVLEAMYLAKIAKEVHVFVRKEQLRANEAGRIAALFDLPNVQVHYRTQVVEVLGDGEKVTGATIEDSEKRRTRFALDGLFLAIGSKPNSELFQGVLQLDENGYIILHKDQQTSIAGVYAVGDIVDPVYKQAVSASGDGAKAALQAQTFLMDRLDHLVRLKQGLRGNERVVVGGSPKNRDVAIKNQEQTLANAARVSSSSKLIAIHSVKQFEQELKSANSAVVVDFYATWCGPCKQVAPAIEASAEQWYGKIKFLKVDVDEVTDLVRNYQIRAMPTVVVLDAKGKVAERRVGADPILELLDSGLDQYAMDDS